MQSEWSIEVSGNVIPFRLGFYADEMRIATCFEVDFEAESPDIHNTVELAEEIALHLDMPERETEIHTMILTEMGYAESPGAASAPEPPTTVPLMVAVNTAAYHEALRIGLLGDEFWNSNYESTYGVLRLVNYFFSKVSDPEDTPALNEVVSEAGRANATYLLLLMEDYS